MSKEAFKKKTLEDHHLDVHTFLDLRNAWAGLSYTQRYKLMTEEVIENDKK